MSRQSHLEPDTLNAFQEGVLPEHERMECLAHLSECAYCREVAFAAQEPQPASPVTVVTPAVTPLWQRWFAPVPVLSGLAATFTLAFGVWMYLNRAPVTPIQEAVLARPAPAAPPAEPAAQPKSATPMVQAMRPPLAAVQTAPASAPPPPPAKSADTGVGLSASLLADAVQTKSSVTSPAAIASQAQGAASELSEIAGTVIDATGAGIPGATVTLRQPAGEPNVETRTDERGQFKISALSAGQYELKIAAKGFQGTSRQVPLQAQEHASVTSMLSVGTVSETVEVTAATPSIQTSTSSVVLPPAPARPSDRTLGRSAAPSVAMSRGFSVSDGTTVTQGKFMVTLKSSGQLEFSTDAGRHWKAVKQLWRGKVVQIGTRAESPVNPEVFQITTDQGSVWLSRDGEHWFPDTPQR